MIIHVKFQFQVFYGLGYGFLFVPQTSKSLGRTKHSANQNPRWRRGGHFESCNQTWTANGHWKVYSKRQAMKIASKIVEIGSEIPRKSLFCWPTRRPKLLSKMKPNRLGKNVETRLDDLKFFRRFGSVLKPNRTDFRFSAQPTSLRKSKEKIDNLRTIMARVVMAKCFAMQAEQAWS